MKKRARAGSLIVIALLLVPLLLYKTGIGHRVYPGPAPAARDVGPLSVPIVPPTISVPVVQAPEVAHPTPPIPATHPKLIPKHPAKSRPAAKPKTLPSAPMPNLAPVIAVEPVAPPPPEPTEWRGSDTAITHSGQVVIHNNDQWIRFWGEHRPHDTPPDIDFSKNMVIGVFAGPRPADGFAIQIVAVHVDGKKLDVDYHETQPPPGTFAVDVTIYPYHIKMIPQSSLPVKFTRLN